MQVLARVGFYRQLVQNLQHADTRFGRNHAHRLDFQAKVRNKDLGRGPKTRQRNVARVFQGDVHIAARLPEPKAIQRCGQKVPKRQVLQSGQDQDHPKVMMALL